MKLLIRPWFPILITVGIFVGIVLLNVFNPTAAASIERIQTKVAFTLFVILVLLFAVAVFYVRVLPKLLGYQHFAGTWKILCGPEEFSVIHDEKFLKKVRYSDCESGKILMCNEYDFAYDSTFEIRARSGKFGVPYVNSFDLQKEFQTRKILVKEFELPS